ncbi:MAG: AAA family ATPase [Dissulfuribacterales bacterium]
MVENNEQIRLKGRVERVTYASLENGFAVLRVKPQRGVPFVATGHIPEITQGLNAEGLELEFLGEWCMTKYGRQFAFSAACVMGSEMLFFLSKVVKGLGPKLAAELLNTYGEERLTQLLDSNPEELLHHKGIKEKRLGLIKRSWQKHRNLKNLTEYLAAHNAQVSPQLIIRIYNHFEDQALAVLQANPYRLTEVRGIGFKTADKLAMSLGIQPDSPFRIKAAVEHLLMNAAESNGHTWLFSNELVVMVKELLSGDDTSVSLEDLLNLLSEMALEGSVVLWKERVGLASYKFMEEWLRQFFVEKTANTDRKRLPLQKIEEFIQGYETSTGFELAEEQKEIIKLVGSGDGLVFGLAGYAGTGKTTVCRSILHLLSASYASQKDIVCCAFTGMAASRLKKATGYEAFTIHSLLKYKSDNTLEYGPDNPLPQKVVLLDEASMVSLPLFFYLARAMRSDAMLILVGDPAQLPPIGAGNVFSDAIQQHLIPAVHLSRIFRQSEDSVITLFANEIRKGNWPDGIEKPGWRDLVFEEIQPHNIFALKKGRTEAEIKAMREANNQAIFHRIQEIAGEYKTKLEHPVWEFQVLTPMKIGQLGTEALNQAIQAILNPQEAKKTINRHGIALREGDKVVHLQNKDMEVMAWEDYTARGRQFKAVETKRIFNGNLGLVAGIDTEDERIYVVYPERIVVAYDADHLGDILELAYALTVHKAQGSQYRIVVIPFSNSHFIMLNNKWLYTAITRAEEKVYLIGQKYALQRGCKNIESVKRQTWLGLQ